MHVAFKVATHPVAIGCLESLRVEHSPFVGFAVGNKRDALPAEAAANEGGWVGVGEKPMSWHRASLIKNLPYRGVDKPGL